MNQVDAPIVAANWKMHPRTVSEAKKLFSGIKRTAPHLTHPTTVICPPDLYLGVLAENYSGSEIILGSQDVSVESDVGSFTGEVSADQIKSTDSSVAIVGHSERRAMDETNEQVAEKTNRALDAGLSVMVCVGEHERDDDGEYLDFLAEQIVTVFDNIDRRFYQQVIIAYEPLWAIGGGSDAAVTPHVLHQTSGFIRKTLHKHVARGLGEEALLLYGGSVKRSNAEKLFVDTKIDGFLIGSASLEADHFCDILRVVNEAYADNYADE
jgi:triosephosphate isomerase